MNQWDTVVRPVMYKQPHMFLCFACYACFAAFGLVNSIIGLIVHKTNQVHEEELEEKRQAVMAGQMKALEEIATVLYLFDVDGSASLNRGEFEEAAQKPELFSLLSQVKMPPAFSLADLHNILDTDGNCEITREEFIDGMGSVVFSSDFERYCTILLTTSDLRRRMRTIAQDVREMPERIVGALRARVETLEALVDSDAFTV